MARIVDALACVETDALEEEFRTRQDYLQQVLAAFGAVVLDQAYDEHPSDDDDEHDQAADEVRAWAADAAQQLETILQAIGG